MVLVAYRGKVKTLMLTLDLRCPTARGSVVWVYSCSGRAATMVSVGWKSGPAECIALLMGLSASLGQKAGAAAGPTCAIKWHAHLNASGTDTGWRVGCGSGPTWLQTDLQSTEGKQTASFHTAIP